MASDAILQRLQAEFDSPPETIRAVAEQLSSGAPVQYLHHFRPDVVGDMAEDRTHAIEERLHFLQELEARKDSIREQAEARGVLTDDLRQTLEMSFDQDLLDDIYQSLRPRRRTPAMQAEEKGLGALSAAVQHRQLGDKSLLDAANEYVSAENGLDTPEQVLEGVALILAERFANDPHVRDSYRRALAKGVLKASALAPTRKGAQRYKQFFDFAEPIRRVSPQRMLALRRAEREGILKVDLCLEEGKELDILRERYAADLTPEAPLREFLDLVFQTAYDNYIREACERDIRRRVKDRADRDTVRTTVRNLRALLMAPPLGNKKVLALRATNMTLWATLVDEDGSVAEARTLPLGLPPIAKPKKPKRKKRRPESEQKVEEAKPAAEAGPESAEAETEASETVVTSTDTEATTAQPEAAVAPADQAAAEAVEAASEPAPAEATPEATPEAAPAAATESAPEAETATPPATEPQATEPPAAEPQPAESEANGSAAPAAETAVATDGEAPATATDGEAPAADADPQGDAEEPAAAEAEPAVDPAVREAAIAELRSAAKQWIIDTVESQAPRAVCIPHGRRQSISERLITPILRDLPNDKRPMLVPVDEAASAIYATTATGRKRLQKADVGIRTAASLGRRLQDPMGELLAMEPRNMGLGQALDEVHQGLLQRHLDSAVSSCLADIGVDLNTTNKELLARAPGLNKELADKIISFRKKEKGFKTRSQLLQVDGMNPERYRFAAGFLRVVGGDEPLDNTPVHPDDYELVQKLAQNRSVEAQALIGDRSLQVQEADGDDDAARAHARGVLWVLSRAGIDPRGELQAAANEGITTIGQLQNNMRLMGRVTNVTDFGAFIDVGVGQDGLVHISQIPGQRRHGDDGLRLGETVEVFVLGVDLEKRKISLSMFRPRTEGAGARGGGRGRSEGGGGGRGRGEGAGGDRRSGGQRRPGGGRKREGDGGRDKGRREYGERPRRGGPPRVVTVESDKKAADTVGLKGELTSLSGLKALLQRKEPAQD